MQVAFPPPASSTSAAELSASLSLSSASFCEITGLQNGTTVYQVVPRLRWLPCSKIHIRVFLYQTLYSNRSSHTRLFSHFVPRVIRTMNKSSCSIVLGAVRMAKIITYLYWLIRTAVSNKNCFVAHHCPNRPNRVTNRAMHTTV